MALRTLTLLLLPVIGGVCAHQFQVRTDAHRWAQAEDLRPIFVPSPEATKVSAMGFDMVIADLFWTRAVLLFVDFLAAEGEDGAAWTRTVLKTVVTLDPRWRTPFFYGGSMLRLLNDVEGSDEIFRDGMTEFPQDPYFPFSLAMNAYLHHEDLDSAVDYLQKAAALPNAPRWYRNAAAEFISRRGQRKAALLYLKQQMENSNSDRERALVESKYKSLLYEQVSEAVRALQIRVERRSGTPIRALNELGELPPDPLGGEWFIATDGVVRSTVQDPVVARRAKLDERAILVNP
ncbi:MAG: hypothetical protein VX944_10505 [Myxococcota bacterium]|nr:hypothetical protein [Myxococcota bacterium]MEC9390492.1 hypothetical protein [Myxococcota bacterium]